MSDLKPLLAGEADELEALLLSAAEDDAPAHGALERAGATLGVSAALLTATAAGGAVAGPVAVAPSAGAVAKQLTWLSLGKWLALGVGVGSVVTGGAHFALAPSSVERPVAPASSGPFGTEERAVPVVALPSIPAPPVTAQTAAPGDEEPALDDAEPTRNKLPGPSAATPPSAPATVAPAPIAAMPGPSSASFAPVDQRQAASAERPVAEPSAAAASTLGEETRALDRVRADIATGKATLALGELEQYGAKWPRGGLATEAALLRVEALLRSGNRAAGEREAAALIARSPRSLYATRARELLRVTAPGGN